VTASRFDRRRAALVLVFATACRTGLSPEPPGADPADAAAPIPAYRSPTNPYETSAFADDKASETVDHGQMHHGHAGHVMPPESAPAATPPASDHSGHGQTDTPAPAHTNHKPEPPR
jgi:hypothetical protein